MRCQNCLIPNNCLIANGHGHVQIRGLLRVVNGYRHGLVIKGSRVQIPTGAPDYRTAFTLIKRFHTHPRYISYLFKNATGVDSRIKVLQHSYPLKNCTLS